MGVLYLYNLKTRKYKTISEENFSSAAAILSVQGDIFIVQDNIFKLDHTSNFAKTTINAENWSNTICACAYQNYLFLLVKPLLSGALLYLYNISTGLYAQFVPETFGKVGSMLVHQDKLYLFDDFVQCIDLQTKQVLRVSKQGDWTGIKSAAACGNYLYCHSKTSRSVFVLDIVSGTYKKAAEKAFFGPIVQYQDDEALIFNHHIYHVQLDKITATVSPKVYSVEDSWGWISLACNVEIPSVTGPKLYIAAASGAPFASKDKSMEYVTTPVETDVDPENEFEIVEHETVEKHAKVMPQKPVKSVQPVEQQLHQVHQFELPKEQPQVQNQAFKAIVLKDVSLDALLENMK